MKKFSIVAVIGTRTLKVTSDGTPEGTVFEGEESDIQCATTTANKKRLVQLGDIGDGPIAQAGYDSPIALAAAMYSVVPQSTYLWRAPDEVNEFIERYNPHRIIIKTETL